MKTFQRIILLGIISIYCSGCAVLAITAIAGGAMLAGQLAGNAAGNKIKNGIENKREGSINITEVTFEKTGADTSQTVVIKGTLNVIPGTKNNERFRNLSTDYFVFLLYDNKAQLLKRIYQRINTVQGGDISNIEVNKPYQFTTRFEKVPNGIFLLIDKVAFEKVANSLEVQENPQLK